MNTPAADAPGPASEHARSPWPACIDRLRAELARPVDGASLAVWRMIFGLILLWEVGRYLHPSGRWLERYFLETRLRFGYWPFEWVQPLPAPWLQIAFGLVGLAALLVAIGLYYRASASLLCLGFGYLFLLDKARYLNHLYLVCLLALLMILVPAQRLWSADAWRRPEIRSDVVPRWSLWLLRLQLAIPYLYGGLAKLNADWFRGEPLRDWLSYRGDFPLLGAYFQREWMVMGVSWSGLLLDLLIVPGLFWKRSRPIAFVAAMAFHLTNARLFSIGIFPWLMIAASTLFLPPEWPRRLPSALRHRPSRDAILVGGIAGWLLGGFLPIAFYLPQALTGAFGGAVAGWLFRPAPDPSSSPGPSGAVRDAKVAGRWQVESETVDAAGTPVSEAPRRRAQPTVSRPLLAFLAAWIAIQLLIPLRHFLIPGEVSWTEEGHRFSWHMKLRDKEARATFQIEDPANGEVWPVVLAEYLSEQQQRKMAARPDMLVQFARYLRAEQAAAGRPQVRVRAEVLASLNGRPEQLLVEPLTDLSRVPWPWWGHADWIRPLEPE